MNTETNETMRDECEYLLHLLAADGDSDVPGHLIPSYFRTQANRAKYANFHALASTLESIAVEIHAAIGEEYHDAIDSAMHQLRGHIFALTEPADFPRPMSFA